MQASFKLGAKNVKESSNNVEKVLCDLKRGRLSEDLFDSVQFEKAAWLVEKLSIVNEYKLNLLKEFSTYNLKKK